MKRYGLFLALLFAPCVLSACAYMLSATLFNNTGEDVAVDWEDDKVAITANHSGEFHYINGDRKREVRLASGGCEYLYYVPPELSNYKPDQKLDRGIQIQVERDFRINLLPADYVGDSPASSETFLKREGFPLQPLSKKCG
jgi:hypothetical protein